MEDEDFPEHKGSLHITHNENMTNYETVEEYISRLDADEQEENKDIFKKCIENNSIWEMYCYPDTPVGFYIVYSDTFQGLFKSNQPKKIKD